jgi:hypothetical protein
MIFRADWGSKFCAKVSIDPKEDQEQYPSSIESFPLGLQATEV